MRSQKPIITQSALIHVRDALEQMRGNRNFTLLFCPLEEVTENFEEVENILIRSIQLISVEDDLWNEMLYEFPFTLEKLESGNALDHSFIN